MAFKYKFNLLGENGRILRKYVLNASTAFAEGDAVMAGTADTEGFQPGEVLEASSGLRVVGIIQAIVTNKGTPPADNGASSAFTGTYTTAASNETGAQVSAIVDISPFSVYSADLDDTIGTTTGSNRAFYYFDLDTGSANNQLNEASSAAPTTGSGQFVSHGLDPEDTNNVLVSIHETFLVGESGI